MPRNRLLIEAAGAVAILACAAGLVLAQGGGPPPVNKCTCGLNTSCTVTTLTSRTCSCCLDGTTSTWICKNCDDSQTFDCNSPPAPFTRCVFDL